MEQELLQGVSQEVAAEVTRVLREQEAPDALMLRQVMRMRAHLQEVDLELAQLQRYFLGGMIPNDLGGMELPARAEL